MRAPCDQKLVERFNFLHQVTRFGGSGLKLSRGPKLIVVAALRNDLIHITRGVGPALAGFRESENMAKRFLGVIKMAALQVRRGLIP